MVRAHFFAVTYIIHVSTHPNPFTNGVVIKAESESDCEFR